MAKTKMAKDEVKPIPIHQWTNGGKEVLVLRFACKEGKSYGDFQHPMAIGETVTAPDWRPDRTCGGGIHGWPWGIGLGDGKEPDWQALWQVYSVKPDQLVGEIGGGPKCKFETGVLRFVGDWHGAMNYILAGQMAWAFKVSEGAASNSGTRGAASNSGTQGAASNSGYQAAAPNAGAEGAASNSGDDGAASNSGDDGAASNSGTQGAASNSGTRGAASNSGYQGAASTTAQGTAAFCTGLESKAMAAEYGCIALAWWNAEFERVEMRCAEIGNGKDKKLKPTTWYKLK